MIPRWLAFVCGRLRLCFRACRTRLTRLSPRDSIHPAGSVAISSRRPENRRTRVRARIEDLARRQYCWACGSDDRVRFRHRKGFPYMELTSRWEKVVALVLKSYDPVCEKCWRPPGTRAVIEPNRARVNRLKKACKLCGARSNLHFHHRNGTDPKHDRTVSQMLYLHWSRIEKEIRKCDVLCASCHQRLHHTQKARRMRHKRRALREGLERRPL